MEKYDKASLQHEVTEKASASLLSTEPQFRHRLARSGLLTRMASWPLVGVQSVGGVKGGALAPALPFPNMGETIKAFQAWTSPMCKVRGFTGGFKYKAQRSHAGGKRLSLKHSFSCPPTSLTPLLGDRPVPGIWRGGHGSHMPEENKAVC